MPRRKRNRGSQTTTRPFFSLGEKHMTQTMKKLVPFVSVIVLMCAGTVALAQSTTPVDYPKLEVFAGYSALGEVGSTGISFGPNSSVSANYTAKAGFDTSIIRNFSKRL